MTQEYEVVIVGAGPAGLSAGIYVARQKVSVLVISKDLGGQLNLIPKLENYPGTIMSSGPLLAKTLESQYLTFQGELVYDTVEKIDEVDEFNYLGSLITKDGSCKKEVRRRLALARTTTLNLAAIWKSIEALAPVSRPASSGQRPLL